jgi:hypothetical protein
MGAWNALLAVGFVLIFVGLFTHWSVIALGALLPFVPVVVSLWRLRRRAAGDRSG